MNTGLESSSQSGLWPSGDVLPGLKGKGYRLLGCLGGGRVAQVWKVMPEDEPETILAAKLMVPGLGAEMRRQFLREPETLKQLAAAEKARGWQVEGVSLVPDVREVVEGEENHPTFFVEILAPGKPLDELLRDNVQFSEQDVLILSEQLCRVFQVLHEDLRRSYLDFQPRNVFWDAPQQRIMVIDWNLLSPEGRAEEQSDLDTLGRLIYRLVAGAASVPGKLDAAPGWANLTSGMQAILSWALQGTVARRYPRVKELRQDLAKLLSWWKQPSERLEKEAARWAERARKRDDLHLREREARRAGHILSIARRKGADETLVASLQTRMKALLQESSALRQGRRLFGIPMYADALERFEEARSEAMTPVDRLLAERWTLAAQAGIGSRGRLNPHTVALETAISRLDEWTRTEWEGSHSLQSGEVTDLNLRTISQETGSVQIGLLADEAQAWAEWLKGRELTGDEWPQLEERAGQMGRAAELLAGLPYRELLRDVWGDLAVEAADLQRKIDRARSRQSRLAELDRLFDTDTRKAIERLRQALRDEPGDADLTGLLLNWAKLLVEVGQPEQAKDCLDWGWETADPRRQPEMIDLRQQVSRHVAWARELTWAESIVRDTMMGTVFEVQWLRLLDLLKDIAAQSAQGGSRQALRDRAWQIARGIQPDRLPPDVLPRLLEVANVLAPSDSALVDFQYKVEAYRKSREAAKEKQRRGQRREQLRQKINQYLAEADIAVRQEPPNFEQALQLRMEALKLVPRLGEADSTKRVEDALRKLIIDELARREEKGWRAAQFDLQTLVGPGRQPGKAARAETLQSPAAGSEQARVAAGWDSSKTLVGERVSARPTQETSRAIEEAIPLTGEPRTGETCPATPVGTAKPAVSADATAGKAGRLDIPPEEKPTEPSFKPQARGPEQPTEFPATASPEGGRRVVDRRGTPFGWHEEDEEAKAAGAALESQRTSGRTASTPERRDDTVVRATPALSLEQQIQNHRQAAMQTALRGGTSNLQSAVQKLDEAVRLSEQLGDSKFTWELREEKERVQDLAWWVGGQERFIASDVKEKNWTMALRLIQALCDRYHRDLGRVPEEVEGRQRDMEFELWAAEFQKVAKSKHPAKTVREREEVVRRLWEALDKLAKLNYPPESEYGRRLSVMRRTYGQWGGESAYPGKASGDLAWWVGDQERFIASYVNEKNWTIALQLIQALCDRYRRDLGSVPEAVEGRQRDMEFELWAAEFQKIAESKHPAKTFREREEVVRRLWEPLEKLAKLNYPPESEHGRRLSVMGRTYRQWYESAYPRKASGENKQSGGKP